jgi:hypothetical protein
MQAYTANNTEKGHACNNILTRTYYFIRKLGFGCVGQFITGRSSYVLDTFEESEHVFEIIKFSSLKVVTRQIPETGDGD